MKSTINPPIAKKKPHLLEIHNHQRVDNYHWLRDRESEAVLAHLRAENKYAELKTTHLEALRTQIYEEMVGRIQETDSSVPFQIKNYFYYTRTEEGKQYPIHCRKHGSLDANETIILDENVMAEGQPYFKIGTIIISPNQELMAYAQDTAGGEVYNLIVENLTTGEIVDQIANVAPTVVWGNDNQTLFYTVQNEAWREYKVMRHTLGQAADSDVELFHEPDELFSVDIDKTNDDAYLILGSYSIESSEIYYLDANMPEGEFALFAKRRPKIEYDLDHRHGEFFIRTNEDASNFKLMKTAVSNTDASQWQTVIPHNPDKLLQYAQLFENHMAVFGRADGLRCIDVYDFDSGTNHTIRFSEDVFAVYGSDNPSPKTNKLRIRYTSMTTSDTIYDYDMDSRELDFLKAEPVLGGYNKDDYVTERIFASARDGAQIPISLAYKKGFKKDGSHACLLYAYGSYGASMEPAFNQKILSLVDRGLVYAIAHIRGGQEMGRHWYENGKFLHKKNTFFDFIDSARYLIDQQFTVSEKLAINGRSAGGLLMGAVTTMAPTLFEVVVAGVPFVDVVTTMLDASIPLTVGEYEEWGNPNDETYYHYMMDYSPYDNTTAQAYPHILITAGLNDPRVQYWEPAKWTAKLREVKTNDNKLLFKVHMGAGHFSSSGRYDYLKDIAFEYAFILDCLGLAD
ncbi:MAG: S9 family peptidase [Chloroflexota bacterium]